MKLINEKFRRKRKKIAFCTVKTQVFKIKLGWFEWKFFKYRESKKSIKNWKEELHQKFISLDNEHKNLKQKLETINLENIKKFENQNKFTKKVDELNQETHSLIEEIDKWQT